MFRPDLPLVPEPSARDGRCFWGSVRKVPKPGTVPIFGADIH